MSNPVFPARFLKCDRRRRDFVDRFPGPIYTHSVIFDSAKQRDSPTKFRGVRGVHYQSNVAALADVALPVEEFRARVVRDVALIVGFALFVALLARFSFHLPFTPVPVTGQTFAVLLTGSALGSWRGVSALSLYLAAGMFLPVYAGSADSYLWDAAVGDYVFGFSSGGSGFFWQMASGGYIIGFVAASWLVGFFCERGLGSSAWILPVLLAGNVLVYVPGLIQLSLFVPDGLTLAWGLYPFIAGDLLKLFLAAMVVPAAWGLVNLLRGDDDYGGGRSYNDRWL